MSRLGDLIRLERTRQGLTHKQVARKCGVSDKYLMEVEAGTSDASIIDLLMAGAMIGEGTSFRFT